MVAVARPFIDVHRTTTFRLGHRPALDGLRGIAVLSVLGMHTNHLFGFSVLPGGFLGVDIFFVLSGFLITSLLLEEYERSGDISLRRFYTRRALRLLPALTLFLITVFILSPYVLRATESAQTRAAVPIAFTYLTDIVISFFGKQELGALHHTWSLAVEEQFYLFWPITLCILLKLGKRQALFFTIGLILLSALLKGLLWNGPDTVPRTYYGPDVRADALMMGCLAAMAMKWSNPRFKLLTIPAIALITVLILTASVFDSWLYFGMLTLIAFAIAVVIVNELESKQLANPLLVWVGKLSYGIYLWHYFVFKAIGGWNAAPGTKLIIALPLTLLCATASYYLVERRFLELKERFA